MIRDFSPGGLLISLDEPTAEGPPVVSVRLEGDPVSTAADVRVVRASGNLLALAFVQEQRSLAARIRERTTSAAPHPAASGSALPAGAQLLQRVLDFVRPRIDGFIDAARERLLDEAERAGSNSAQAPCFEASTQLRKAAKGLGERFADRLREAGVSFEPIPVALHDPRGAQRELSLVDETEFEIWLVESEIAGNAEGRLHELLGALQTRLSAAVGRTVESENNPFGPRALAHHMAAVLEESELSPLARRFALKSFGREVLNDGAGLYAVLNELLIEAGIYPDGVPRPERRRADRAPPLDGIGGWEEPAPAPDTQGPAGGPAIRGVPREGPPPPPSQGMAATLMALRQMASGQAAPRPAPPAGPGRILAGNGGETALARATEPTHTLDHNEFEALLGELQSLAGASSQQRLQDRLMEVLGRQGAEGEQAALDQEQSRAVYLADEIVSVISEDLIASEQGKRWIKQLEIPLLRLLIDNPNVLAQPSHPGRRLLDQLGQVHWRSESPSPRETEMIERIDGIVGDLVAGGRVAEADLEKAARQVEHLVRRQLQRVEANMRRVLETCRGQERLGKAKRRVNVLLEEQFGGREVPQIILEMLDSGYRDLMALEALRAEGGEDASQEELRLLERLRERLDAPPQDPLTDDDQALLGQVEERLGRTPAEPEVQKELLDRLRRQFASVEDRGTRTFHPQPLDDDLEEEYPSTEQEKLWLGQAKLLKVGDWMICPDENGQARPIRLAWISEDERRYVFVDRDGQRALDLRQSELAEKLGTQDAEIADSGGAPLIQRSWRGLIQRMHDQIAHQATHDETTGLLNRKEFERRLRLKLSESKLAGTQHAVLLVDIDGFRVINTTAGHETGDRLLREIGSVIGDQLPDGAELARVGSDEFAVLVPRCSEADSDTLAERLRGLIAAHRLKWKRRKLQVTASIGIAAVDRDSAGLSEVFTHMEVARDAAREDGDMVRRFRPDDQELARKDRALQQVARLEEALDADCLELHAHRISPLCAEATGEQYEVLARLRLPDGELVTPEHFVHAAESHGRVHLLDHAVLDSALAQLAASPRRGQISRLCVNVSGQTFSRPHFADDVAAALERHAVDSKVLCLEITESAAMSDLSRCADVLLQLKEMGCRFSLDDFGTGLSSFSYLKHLPVDYLKIDGSFIREIDRDTHDLGLVRTIHEIAHLLGKQTVAEFVESLEIAEVLRSIGIDFVQGHGIEEPRPLREVLHG